MGAGRRELEGLYPVQEAKGDMSRYTDPDAARTRIYRALIVDEYGATSWDEYIRRTKAGAER